MEQPPAEQPLVEQPYGIVFYGKASTEHSRKFASYRSFAMTFSYLLFYMWLCYGKMYVILCRI